MAGYYRIDLGTWQAIQGLWQPRIDHNPQQFGGHPGLVDREAQRLQAGGPARQIPTLQYQNLERGAEQVGSALLGGLSALGNALDSAANKALLNVGSRVMVQWSDGNRYPGTIALVGQGQYQVTMQNGQQVWVPAQFVSVA